MVDTTNRAEVETESKCDGRISRYDQSVNDLVLCMSCVVLVGCAGAKPAPKPETPADPKLAAADADRAEISRRAKLSAVHRELEAAQAEALAATCAPKAPVAPRCEPSCYRAEAADPRAGKRHPRAEVMHFVCEGGESGRFTLVDEIGGAKVGVKPARKVPRPHKKGGWEVEVEAAVTQALGPEVARGDVVRVTGTWQPVTHPLTKAALRCTSVSHFTALAKPLDECGGRGKVTCEAVGNAAAHGINVVHYRLAEARRLEAAGDLPGCQRAALEAIAVAHGLPRWRQYMTLNVATWTAYARYRTRFDGILDEETLFTTAAALGNDARAVYGQCGGATVKTTVAQEQSFHTCW